MLDFLININTQPISDLLAYDKYSVPEMPGAYILIANAGTEFTYPAGNSPVFYIGQGINLKKRLNLRRQQISQAKRRQPRRIYPPQFEYGAAFGSRFTYILATESQYPKSLEDQIMAMFANRFHCLPAANGAGAWARMNQIIETAAWT